MRYKDYQSGGFNQPIELYSVDANWNRTDHAIANRETHREAAADSFIHLYADFRDAIREQRQPMAPAAAGARALEIVLGAYASAVTGRVMALPLDRESPVYRKGIEGIADLEAWAHSTTKAAGLFGLRG